MDKLIFDIGATNTKFALMSTDGEILARENVPSITETIDGFFDNLVKIAAKYRNNGDEIAISTNGRMCLDGNTYRAYIPNSIQGVNLKNEMEIRMELPVTILNDGYCAALGEWWKGSGQGYKNFLTVVLGSGIGGGLILDGKLYQGSKRNAAMLFGMLGSYGGGKYDISSLTTSFSLLLYQLSAMKQIPKQEMTGQRFFDYVAQGDPSALEMLDLYCESIAGIIFNSSLLLDLDGTVVTGGLSEQEVVIDIINRKLREIPEKALQGRVGRFFNMSSGDYSDFHIQVKQGTLSLDANVYGALYYLIHNA
jgi:predicted NBD/HSP70 family sugar kinase